MSDTKKPRKSTKSVFVIQKKDGNNFADIDMPPLVESTADCIQYIKDNKLEGEFRIIAVRATIKTKAVQITKVAFE